MVPSLEEGLSALEPVIADIGQVIEQGYSAKMMLMLDSRFMKARASQTCDQHDKFIQETRIKHGLNPNHLDPKHGFSAVDFDAKA
ncbi:hypothetical protein GOP47_0012314 [Adiantum capillus-veneris]|uniref:Uncharacterized protein n=1 Tax=Adiantum capillus-veneris TaxID=13818 RepID=A0A9D4UQF9_ADICA|nr:hypothetical protein GOP47_0012314 [Adiantum capillus-veneris]